MASLLRKRLCIVLLLLVGCDSGWEPTRDVSRFESAVVADDSRLGVFTYKRRVYRPASGWRGFPDGGPAKDLLNENGVATYDPVSGSVRVLWRQDVLTSR